MRINNTNQGPLIIEHLSCSLLGNSFSGIYYDPNHHHDDHHHYLSSSLTKCRLKYLEMLQQRNKNTPLPGYPRDHSFTDANSTIDNGPWQFVFLCWIPWATCNSSLHDHLPPPPVLSATGHFLSTNLTAVHFDLTQRKEFPNSFFVLFSVSYIQIPSDTKGLFYSQMLNYTIHTIVCTIYTT